MQLQSTTPSVSKSLNSKEDKSNVEFYQMLSINLESLHVIYIMEFHKILILTLFSKIVLQNLLLGIYNIFLESLGASDQFLTQI